DITVAEGLDILSSLCAVEFEINGRKIQSIPRPAGMGKKLLEKASVRLPKALPFREGKVATKKSLVIERM
ncbi:MAG: hypothetical protein D6785_14000, partial [Planctomycetota bacterium]